LVYAGLAVGIASDHQLAAMTRRELAAFFFSPIAYIVLAGFIFLGMIQFYIFVKALAGPRSGLAGNPVAEPIVARYVVSLFPVIGAMIAVPLVTMRLLSEEKRTGTLEVLLTAPVTEGAVVLSKFLAALVFFILLWVPWGLFLIALRVGGEQPFEYRPLLSFFLCLMCWGAGFLAMGLFCSSLTRNQIIAFLLGFIGMMILLGFYIISLYVPEESAWKTVLAYASFVDAWGSTLQGKLSVRDILFPVSSAVLWLFATVRVMEARKWQ
jgi:ABC-type transport system involved in multi-copper enzyme maturation permease subunit